MQGSCKAVKRQLVVYDESTKVQRKVGSNPGNRNFHQLRTKQSESRNKKYPKLFYLKRFHLFLKCINSFPFRWD